MFRSFFKYKVKEKKGLRFIQNHPPHPPKKGEDCRKEDLQ